MTSPALDQTLAALADPTRRAIVSQLCAGPAPVSELSAPHDMALPSFLKHLRALEAAGLVETRKQGRQRICTLRSEPLGPLADWISGVRDNAARPTEPARVQARAEPSWTADWGWN